MPDPVVYKIITETDDFQKELRQAQLELRLLNQRAIKAAGGLTETQKAKQRVTKATKAATKAQKEKAAADKAAAKVARDNLAIGRAIVKETKRATAATKAATAAENKRAGELKQGMNAVLGDQVNKVSDVGTAFGTMGLAVVGSAAAGVAALGAFAVVTTATLNGIIALTSGVVDLTREMDGYSVEVNDANDAMDAAASVVGVLKGELATELAPEVERAARLLAAMGLAAADGFEVLADGSNIAFEVITRLTSLGIRPGTEAMLTAIEVANGLAEAMGVTLPEGIDEWIVSQRLANAGLTEGAAAFESAEEALDDYLVQVDLSIVKLRKVEAKAKKAAEASSAQAKAEKDHARDVARAKEKAAAEAERVAAEAAKQQAARFKQQIQAEDELRNIASNRAQSQLSDLEKLEQARDDEIDKINTLVFLAGSTVEAEEAALDARLVANEEFYQDRFNLAIADAEAGQALRDEQNAIELAADQKKRDEQRAGAEALRDALIDAAATATNAIIAGFSEQNRQYLAQQDEQLDAAIALLEMKKSLNGTEIAELERLKGEKDRVARFNFLREKGEAFATAGVNTAVAVTAAAAIGPPQNVPFIAAAAALGAVQLGIIAGTKFKKAHDGEASVQSFSAPTSGEVDRRLVEGESVLNQRATNAIGVDAINAANNTGTAGGGGRTVIMLDGEELARSTVRHMRGDGALATVVRGQSLGIGPAFGGR